MLTIEQLEKKIKSHQKLIYQLNDLISTTLNTLKKYPGFENIESDVNDKFEKLKKKVYQITGNIETTKYNLNENS